MARVSVWISTAALAAGVVMLTACGPASNNQSSGAPAGAQTPAVADTPVPVDKSAAAPVTAAATASALPATQAVTATALPPGMFQNPVYDKDFPDPDVLKLGDIYYAYGTNANNINVQVIQSTDLVHWSVPEGTNGEALPVLPGWADPAFGWSWAPEVYVPANGQGYVMYSVARFKIGTGGGTQCIAAAAADLPQGPFKPAGDKPLICQVDEGGSIDASTFVDEDGKHYILWKNDGNSGGGQTFLYIQPLAQDGLSLTGEPVKLITADKSWEGVLVEAPTLWKHVGKYYLFYSANAYNTTRYATGYAVADALLGPYTKPATELLKTMIGAGIVGPGGQDIVIGPNGGEWILFHGWSGESYRRLYLAPLTWDGGKPVVKIEGRGPMKAP